MFPVKAVGIQREEAEIFWILMIGAESCSSPWTRALIQTHKQGVRVEAEGKVSRTSLRSQGLTSAGGSAGGVTPEG